MTTPWHLYHGHVQATDPGRRKRWLEDADAAPPWRRPPGPWSEDTGVSYRRPDFEDDGPASAKDRRRADSYRTTQPDGGDASHELDRVNAALMLRRPLLVTGPAGVGKSSLAYSIARRMGLGRPLRWEINSRMTLHDGLYQYDAVGHLRAVKDEDADDNIGRFITLGPLGTALLPTREPRVLLIDELDKASYDLPNDLLHVFEEGEFTIPELTRESGEFRVGVYDSPDSVTLHDGRVQVHHHPVVVITSNNERDFPDAFNRRCIDLQLARPDLDSLVAIVTSWFVTQEKTELDDEAIRTLVSDYHKAGQATDAVLQALFMRTGWNASEDATRRAVLRPASATTGR